MSRRPPTDPTLEQALAWPGAGRTPTFAHPDCSCHVSRDQACCDALLAGGALCRASRKACLMHGEAS